MENKISLKDTERKVFRSTFQDGLVDFAIGSFLLMFTIAPLLSQYLGDFWSSAVFLPFFAVVFAVLWLIRKRIVKPRLGIVNVGSWRKSRMVRFNVIMFPILVLASILGILSIIRFDSVPGWVHTARFSLVFLIGFSLAGYYLDFPRLFVYGVLIASAPLIGELLYETYEIPHHGIPLTFGIASGSIMITGVFLFIRLLRDYPLKAHPAGSPETAE